MEGRGKVKEEDQTKTCLRVRQGQCKGNDKINREEKRRVSVEEGKG